MQSQSQLPALKAPPPQNLEAMMCMLLKSQLQSEERIDQVNERLDQLSAHNNMLENQLANQASTSSTKVTGKLPACTENPIAHVNAIVTRTGKILSELSLPIETSIPNKIVDVEIEEKLDEEEVEPAILKPNPQVRDEMEKPVRRYEPPFPFPQKFQKQVKESRWKKFLEVVESLKVSMPLLDLLSQVPSYGKFLRDILAKKRKYGEQEMIAMAQEYRALTPGIGKPLRKHRDLGKFTIPCVIGGRLIKRSLYDLGSNVNVMPLSLCQNLNLRVPQPTQLTLQFVDQSSRSPIGIIEDVLVRVDKCFVPCDFIVIDVQENPNVPIILGRPFLATTGAVAVFPFPVNESVLRTKGIPMRNSLPSLLS
ncbi:PREDICTED: uncharacterized protein LOC109166457 [Ipomoea nil]|uniref:uncharacterized protein LOC109166457 n=1 Tax=Ipomoea nil TaxID=35883 RepID=UPI000901A17D|nr:PREDICTED: uncharacterized protein LOC109166457 [Ipomoea nil]